jgi:hypothetical protein
MRRFLSVLVLTAFAATALSSAALAKEGGVELSSMPAGTSPGEPWTPTLHLIRGTPELLAQAKPGVTIRNVDTGERLTFPAEPTADPRVYDVRVVFPEEGWYRVEAFDGVSGRSYEFGGQWYIDGPGVTPVPGPPAASVGDESSFPVWPVAAGSTAILLAAVGAALFLRRQRLGLSHS